MAYTARMDGYRFAAVALIVGIVGPLFWLAVGKFDLWVKRTPFGQRMLRLGDRINALPSRVLRSRKTAKTAKQLSRPPRVGE